MSIGLSQHLLHHSLVLLSCLVDLKRLVGLEVPCTSDAVVLSASWFALIDLQFFILGWVLQILVDLIVIPEIVLGLYGAMQSFVPSLHSLSSLTASHLLLDC